MFVSRRALLAGALALASILTLVAIVVTTDDDGTSPVGVRAAGGATLPEPVDTLEYVPLDEGCRFFDTRKVGGPIAAFAFREFRVLINIVDQGGLPKCIQVIPSEAIAVEVSLSTIGGSPTNNGYLRVGPGGEEPTSTVLQFLKGQGTSVTTTVRFDRSVQKIRVKAFDASTHVAGDLLGYWQRSLRVTVEDNEISSGNFSSVGLFDVLSDVQPGRYAIFFYRSISGCAPIATALEDGRLATAFIDYDAEFTPVIVQTTDVDGGAADAGFSLAVVC